MKSSLFMNQFEISLKKLQEKKGCGSKKRALSQRMTENPLFYLSDTKINGLSSSDSKELAILCKRLQTLL